MVRFVDLETGNTFDGSYPYVFWFGGGQSTNIIYSQKICFISNNQTEEISLEENDIFHLIDPTKLLNTEIETIYGFEYRDLKDLQTYKVTSQGTSYHNYFVHMIYVLGVSENHGEYIVDINIGGDVFNIGADFYTEDETLSINLANNGIEIPSSIQKALYDVNLHEENSDNIVLNRKWKELLSNFWDVIANKGSYKSLFNSLKWFEYGDSVKLCEVWKNISTNKYFIKDIQQTLTGKYTETLNGFAKTTYIALYHTLEKLVTREDGSIVFDEEKNPQLEYITSKWSTQDLALKLCMLGSFYEMYFMPIHLDLLHSTIEDVVYSNTFKVRIGTAYSREDFVYHNEDIQCSVKDGDVFRLGLVQCYVGPDTLFSTEYNSGVMVGVQNTVPNEVLNNDELRNYIAQMYNEIGSVVDFKIHIPGADIKREVIVFKTYNKGAWKEQTVVNNKIFKNELRFSLLCPIEGEYDVRLQFDAIDGRTFTKRVKFNVIDTNQTTLEIYRIQNLGSSENREIGDFQINNSGFSNKHITQYQNLPISQYIPSKIINPADTNYNYKGVCLNHLLIFFYNPRTISQSVMNYLNEHYFLYIKNTDTTTYLICISKQYGFIPEIPEYDTEAKPYIYRDDYIFMPEFHKLVPFIPKGGEHKLDCYKITNNDALCVIPKLSFGKYISEYDWEFINKSTGQVIKLKDIKEPFIAATNESFLSNGYYTVVFKYRLTNEEKINTIILDSAFIKV